MSKERAIKTLKSFRLLKYNWDGYGAEPFDSDLINKCIEIVEKLVYTPNVYPTFRNSIQFEYTIEQKYLEIEIYDDNCTVLVTDNNMIVTKRVIKEDTITKVVDWFHEVA